jgi:hypothetical protein
MRALYTCAVTIEADNLAAAEDRMQSLIASDTILDYSDLRTEPPRFTVSTLDGFAAVIDNERRRYALFNHSAREVANILNADPEKAVTGGWVWRDRA